MRKWTGEESKNKSAHDPPFNVISRWEIIHARRFPG